MNISFDLDGLLIAHDREFEPEFVNLFKFLLLKERLRRGTTSLIKNLQGEGHKVFVYTTSLRSKQRIWWLFRLHGIHLNAIINLSAHNKNHLCRVAGTTKFPPAFGIDVHVDDSPGVAIEGKQKGFEVIVISPFDKNWMNNLYNELLQFKSPGS